jgi:hypothetical protein
MVNHFGRKRVCSAFISNVVLTSEITICILENRVYRPAKKEINIQTTKITNNNTTNNYNLTINCINNMSLDHKIKLMIDHMGMKIEPINDTIQKKTQMFIEDQGELKSIADLRSLAKYICQPQSDDEIFNPVYAKKQNTCSLLNEDSERYTLPLTSCITTMLEILRDQTIGEYEIELVKNHNSGMRGSRESIVALYSYYKDVGITPYIEDMHNDRIYGDPSGDRDYSISVRHMKIFDTCKKSNCNNQAQLKELIRSVCNVHLLNKKILVEAQESDDFNNVVVLP